MPSSNGELTVQFETRTFLQASMSIPSRFVSIFTLSIVRLSTPVAKIAKCPPCKIEISRMRTLRQSFRLIDLLPQPGSTPSRGFEYPNEPALDSDGTFAKTSFYSLIRD